VIVRGRRIATELPHLSTPSVVAKAMLGEI
jgi:hypothetical protein